jgi:GNAT superfamily N-acetyltransferase
MEIKTKEKGFLIREAERKDVPLVLSFIRKMGEYEKLSHEVVASEELLERYLFGNRRFAEVILGYYNEVPVGFALYFFNFSTFLSRPGIYLEDIFVLEEYRRMGFGKVMLSYLAKTAVERECGRLEWVVLDWNEPSIKFYKSLGAKLMNEWIITRMTGPSLKELADQF